MSPGMSVAVCSNAAAVAGVASEKKPGARHRAPSQWSLADPDPPLPQCAYRKSAPPASSQKGKDILLVLTRRPGQSIMIGDGIEVTILRVSVARDTVRFGINAPREVRVARTEVRERQILQDSKLRSD